jgi:hypothetical protein
MSNQDRIRITILPARLVSQTRKISAWGFEEERVSGEKELSLVISKEQEKIAAT